MVVSPEGGKEALEKEILRHWGSDKEWTVEMLVGWILPIIGGMLSAREEAIRKEGRLEVVEWICENHGHCIGTLEYIAVSDYKWQAQLKTWCIQGK